MSKNGPRIRSMAPHNLTPEELRVLFFGILFCWLIHNGKPLHVFLYWHSPRFLSLTQFGSLKLKTEQRQLKSAVNRTSYHQTTSNQRETNNTREVHNPHTSFFECTTRRHVCEAGVKEPSQGQRPIGLSLPVPTSLAQRLDLQRTSTRTKRTAIDRSLITSFYPRVPSILLKQQTAGAHDS